MALPGIEAMRSIALIGIVFTFAIDAGGIFFAFPGIDLWVSRQFYVAPTAFTLSGSPGAAIIRGSVEAITYALFLGLPLGLIFTWKLGRPVLGLDLRAWLFLILAFAIGPGLIVNAVLKEHWGRARPSQIVEFGGTRSFTPALVISDQCRSNCAFTSGDAALGFATAAFAFVVSPRRRKPVLAGGVALGSLYGVVRILQGGHFLSDVVFSLFFTLLPILLLNYLLLERRWTPS